jgi:hypothetical protein
MHIYPIMYHCLHKKCLICSLLQYIASHVKSTPRQLLLLLPQDYALNGTLNSVHREQKRSKRALNAGAPLFVPSIADRNVNIRFLSLGGCRDRLCHRDEGLVEIDVPS